MFIGHANIELEGQRTLAFTDRRRELVAVRPATLANMLGQFSPARGGPLELVFLNGCESEALGKAVRRAGIPNVVCWRTLVENGVKLRHRSLRGCPGFNVGANRASLPEH